MKAITFHSFAREVCGGVEIVYDEVTWVSSIWKEAIQKTKQKQHVMQKYFTN